jgi:hypothetical protein
MMAIVRRCPMRVSVFGLGYVNTDEDAARAAAQAGEERIVIDLTRKLVIRQTVGAEELCA